MTPTLAWMQRDPFERLPTEIIIQILQYVDDIVLQDDLRSFIPRVDSVVGSNSWFLLRQLISGPKVTLKIRRLIYGIATIHDSSTKCRDLDEYLELIYNDAVCRRLRMSDAIALKIIDIAVRIERLTPNCLAILKHDLQTSKNKHIRYDPSQDHPAWIEEAEVYRTLWHLHHYSDLRKVTNSAPMTLTRAGPAPRGGETWTWPRGSLDSLKKYKDLASRTKDFLPSQAVIARVSDALEDLGVHGRLLDGMKEYTFADDFGFGDDSGSEDLPFFASFEPSQQLVASPMLFSGGEDEWL
ncbi:hypothetical protein BJY00DRAFT_311251 [Aspergillus carlsbadensis]|nr:hypothetical protein BJY00DRAFT_311251 [Aspergillus carlsbadensis]